MHASFNVAFFVLVYILPFSIAVLPYIGSLSPFQDAVEYLELRDQELNKHLLEII